jgi:adenylate kinase
MLGPPGAGKGTQAQLAAERLGVPAVSTGDLFRAAAADDSDVGRAARSAMADGRLAPDSVTNALVARRLGAADAAGGFVLDGFPRTLVQAAELDRCSRCTPTHTYRAAGPRA